MDLSVCLVATELFAWGRYGGFGFSTRKIGASLAERGVDVSVVVPRWRGQEPAEELDGMTVHSFPLHMYPFTGSLYADCDSDVYHSEEPSMGSRVAMDSVPGRAHVVTCQNPKTKDEWGLVNRFYPLRRRAFNALFGGMLSETVRRMDAVYCQARYIAPKVKSLYGLDEEPGFLPNPVDIPQRMPEKAAEPTACFLGRLNGEKRPALFFGLAKRFPGVRFIAMGRSHDGARDRRLRRLYRGIRNLELPGFVAGEEKERLLGESWVLVNTSVSECLPVSFLEAAAHGCAILSFHDPDGFASGFGYHASDGDLDRGLRNLLGDEAWKEKGEKGYAYASEVHETGRVIDRHLAAYKSLLEGG
jgi:glycosyltransferase involved in cell wall biosynthesis